MYAFHKSTTVYVLRTCCNEVCGGLKPTTLIFSGDFMPMHAPILVMQTSCKAAETSALRVLAKKRGKTFHDFVVVYSQSFLSTYSASSRGGFNSQRNKLYSLALVRAVFVCSA